MGASLDIVAQRSEHVQLLQSTAVWHIRMSMALN